MVKSNFELFSGRRSLADRLLQGIHFSFPTKLSAFANKTRGIDPHYNSAGEAFAKEQRRCSEVYLSEKQARELDDALVAANKAIENDYSEQKAAGRDCLDVDTIGQVVDRLWEKSGPMQDLRNLAEKFFEEAQKNPIEHVVEACAAKLAKANETVRQAQSEINSDLHAALNGRRFPEQLEFPFPQEKTKRKIRFGIGGVFDNLSQILHPWDRGY